MLHVEMMSDEEISEILEDKAKLISKFINEYKRHCKKNDIDPGILGFLDAVCISASYAIDQFSGELREQAFHRSMSVIVGLFDVNTEQDIKVQ